jgi:predicted metal-dependent enzyme (double-stranded beta helix superfamily)
MDHSLEDFASQCHRILKASPGPSGRQEVCNLLQELLADPQFVATYVDDSVPARKVLYEDPDLGFTILAHRYEDASESQPHDHGPSWAIYGQAMGETEMTQWELLEPASAEKPGKVRKGATTTLKPGMAFAYHEGDLHSPRRAGPTRLIRIEGQNMDRIKRFRYEAVG